MTDDEFDAEVRDAARPFWIAVTVGIVLMLLWSCAAIGNEPPTAWSDDPPVARSSPTAYQRYDPPTPVTVTPATARAPVGHTHTCKACGTVWDHSANPTHVCPLCRRVEFEQDQFPRPVNLSGSPVAPSFGGGCANGQCETPQRQLLRRPLFPLLKR